MKNYFVVGLLTVMLILSSLIGVDLLKKNEELHILLDKQSDIINDNKKEISNYKKAIDELNQRVRDQDGVIKEKNDRIIEVKKALAEKEKEVEKLKKQSPLANVSRGESVNKRQLNMSVTAYIAQCKGCSGRTFSGELVTDSIYYNGLRIIAANFNKLPLYSIVRIDTNTNSYKAIVLDTGGAIRYSNTIDLLVNSYDEAIQFGRQKATITVLREGGKG